MGKITKFSTKLKKIREHIIDKIDKRASEFPVTKEREEDNLLRFIDHVSVDPSWKDVLQSELEHDDFEQELAKRVELLTDRIDYLRKRLQREQDKYVPRIKSNLIERKFYLGIRKWLHYQKPNPTRYVSPLRLYEDKQREQAMQLLKKEKHED